MDRNQAAGLILFAAVLLIYSIFFATTPEPLPEELNNTNVTQTIPQESVALDTIAQEIMQPDSIQDLIAQRQFGVFAPMTKGTAEEVVLENDLIAVTLSTKGAEIVKVVL